MESHLYDIRSILPWCFAYDKGNYARYLSPYFAEMTNLPEKKPDLYEAFKAGHVSVQLSISVIFPWIRLLKLPLTRTLRHLTPDTTMPSMYCRNKFSL